LASSWGNCMFIQTDGNAPLYVLNATLTDLDPLTFILHFNQFRIASMLVCSFCDAMVGSLTEESYVYYLNLYEEVSAMQIGF
jgi:hypothetical protein